MGSKTPERERERDRDRIKAAMLRRHTQYRSAIATYKLEQGCTDCGYDKDPAALEFDHVDGARPNKSVATHQGWGAMLAEMDRCEVVCANCHRVRTRDRGQYAGYYGGDDLSH